MRCKPGHMAIRIKISSPHNPADPGVKIGAIVTCIKLIDQSGIFQYFWIDSSLIEGDVWEVEYNGDTESYAVPDEDLMPINPDESSEESVIAMEKLMETTKEVETV